MNHALSCNEMTLRKITGKSFLKKILSDQDLAQWQWLQDQLDALTSVLHLPILAIGKDSICICGTDIFYQARGFQVPESSTISYVIQTGTQIIQIRGENDQCEKCQNKDICRNRMNFTGAIKTNGKLYFVIQIVAYTKEQQHVLMINMEKACSIIQLISDLATFQKTEHLTSQQNALSDSIPEIVGESQRIHQLKAQILKAASSESTVLIQGESGTGKELVAKAIHDHSERCKNMFVALNCAAIPESLVESELFGYEAGSFSGANPRGKKGLMEIAHEGTLFLDEIADMPMTVQVKLLRAIQERSFMRVGGKTLRMVNVRIIAASNKNLKNLVREKKFREDLYYRLNVLPIHVPPLRERSGDVSLLTACFLEYFSKKRQHTFHITSELLNAFEKYHWPGNVRELRNFIEYGVNFCENDIIDIHLMKDRFELEEPAEGRQVPLSGHAVMDGSLHRRLKELGKGMSAKYKLAEELGISIATLYRRLKAERGE